MYEDEIVVMLGASAPSESKSKHLMSIYKRVLSQFRTLLSNKSINKICVGLLVVCTLSLYSFG